MSTRQFISFLKACLMLVVFSGLSFAATLTVTVNDTNGSAVPAADVIAVTYSTSGPVAVLQQTNGSGVATLTLTNNLQYQLVAVKHGYLPAAREQMFSWQAWTPVGTSDITKPIQLRAIPDADKTKYKDILVRVTHSVPAGKLLFLNLMNKGTYEQAGMGFLSSTGTATTPCYIYSAPTNVQDFPFQLSVFDQDNNRGSNVAVNNKPDTTTAADASDIDISPNSGAMAPPSRQLETDEKLGDIALEGVIVDSSTLKGIEGVSINIHDNTDNKLNMNSRSDSNGYFAFYENADTTTKIFKTGHDIGINLMKTGYVEGSGNQIVYTSTGTRKTMKIGLNPVNGKIKGIVNIKVGSDLIPIPQAWVNAWGDGRNYGTSDVWNSTGSDRVCSQGGASGPVTKGQFVLVGLPSGRFTLNLWSEFNNTPVNYNAGPDGVSPVDSCNWNTANTNWGDDYLVVVDTATTDSAKVYTAKSPHAEVTSARDSSGNIIINIEKKPDGTNSITGQITFLDTTTPIDPSSVLIVARENWKNDGTQPKSGFTVLKAADKVSDYVYNYSITGLGNAVYRVEVKAPGFGMKFDNNGPRTNEGITLSASAATMAVNLKMAPSGYIAGIMRTPKGVIYVPKYDGMDNSNGNVNANCNEIGAWGSAQVDKDGNFRIEGLLPGKYQIQANVWTGGTNTSDIYADVWMNNIVVEAGKTTNIEVPLKKGVKIHPKLSAELPAAMKAALEQDPTTGAQQASMSIVYTPASVALSAKNIDEVFHMGSGGNQQNTINYWGGIFNDLSVEPGAYNFYLIYERHEQNSNNYAKTVIGRLKNFVVDQSKMTDTYTMSGSTMNPPGIAQFVPIPYCGPLCQDS